MRPTLFNRALPHSFHDQAVESLKALHPQVEFVERVRAGQIGDLSYALVAWKTDARADRVELSVVAVKGERAWELEGSSAASAYPAARKAIFDRLQTLSGPEERPQAAVEVRAKGRTVPVPAASVPGLVSATEVLIASCASRTGDDVPEPSPPQFESRIRYAQARPLGLGLRDRASLEVEEIRIVADDRRNEGWPMGSVRAGGRETGLGMCDGAATLKLLCRPELRPYVPTTVTRNCRSGP